MQTFAAMRDTSPLYKQLCELGVSRAYASQIANGHRKPSLALALRLHDAFGVKVGPTADKTDGEIKTLRRASHLLENGSAA